MSDLSILIVCGSSLAGIGLICTTVLKIKEKPAPPPIALQNYADIANEFDDRLKKLEEFESTAKSKLNALTMGQAFKVV